MDQVMYLQACPLCILTRYVFGLVAISGLLGYLINKQFISAILITISSLIGLFVTSRQIYIFKACLWMNWLTYQVVECLFMLK